MNVVVWMRTLLLAGAVSVLLSAAPAFAEPSFSLAGVGEEHPGPRGVRSLRKIRSIYRGGPLTVGDCYG